jgi:hypothetical protein
MMLNENKNINQEGLPVRRLNRILTMLLSDMKDLTGHYPSIRSSYGNDLKR